jgi:hypothetical protein
MVLLFVPHWLASSYLLSAVVAQATMPMTTSASAKVVVVVVVDATTLLVFVFVSIIPSSCLRGDAR